MLEVGDRVRAQWPVEIEWWYPAVVCGVHGSRREVQFDDGARVWLLSRQVVPLVLPEGNRVFGRWQWGPYYYPGAITAQLGQALHVEYDDGDEEWLTVSMVRLQEEDLPTSA